MKKQNLFLLINFVVLLIVGLAFVVINDKVNLKKPEDKLFGQQVELVNGQKLSSIPYMSKESVNFQMADYKWIAKDKNNKTLGFVYHAVIKNDFSLTGSGVDYGFIELLVGINLKGEVSVEYLTIYQTQWAIVGVQKYIQDYYQNVPYKNINKIPSFDADIVSGATAKPATVSTDAIKALVQSIVADHFHIVDENPYEALFGVKEPQLTNDDTFVPKEYTTQKQIVSDGTSQLGYIYSVAGRGEYQDGAFDSIVMEIVFNTEDKIIGFVLPEETYKHSGGNFKNKNVEYLKSYVGLTVDEIKAVVDAAGNQDLTSGATNTRLLIDTLLKAFVDEYVKETVGPYDELFGKSGLEIKNTDGFVPTVHIITKQTVMDGANTLGYIYSVKGTGEYRNTFFDSIVIEIIFGSDNKIIDIRLPEGTYNHSSGNWKVKNETYILNYIGLSVGEISGKVTDGVETDVTSGASNTRSLIDSLLEAFASEVN